jgi:5S rRNA maturation endonuclease (ribonuclease M5)
MDLQWLAEHYRKAVTKTMLNTFAKSLGLVADSLARLRVGWDAESWTFPMVNAANQTVGIRRRLPDGKKLSVKGGHEGLFVPHDLNGESPIFVCEGPTDTASLLGLGLPAVGRPSCSGGVAYLVTLCQGRRVMIMADGDAPGLRGAKELQAKLKDATIVKPPDGSKDVREFVCKGATRDDVLKLMDVELSR